MLCVEDYLDALRWAKSIGGLDGLLARADANFTVHRRLGRRRSPGSASWRPTRRPAPTPRSACASSTRRSPRSTHDGAGGLRQGRLSALLEKEGVAYDIAAYRDAPPGLRIWCGATVETSDLEALMPWLDWAFATAESGADKAAA